MLDRPVRAALAPTLSGAGRRLAAWGVPAAAITGAGWLLGVAACVAAGTAHWLLAAGLWLANRVADGLDGPTARATAASDTGAFLDIVADFTIYAGFVVGVAVAVPAARLACVALLAAYYASGTAFLALSSLLERRRQPFGDNRSLRFVGGLAEGTETVLVYVAFCLFHRHAGVIGWTFAAAVAITAAQRVIAGVRLLRTPAPVSAHRHAGRRATRIQEGSACLTRTPTGPQALPAPALTVYWRPGCPYCAGLRRQLRRHQVPADWRNIWQEPAAAAFVRSAAGGNETVPTVVVGARTSTRPGAAALTAAGRRPRARGGSRLAGTAAAAVSPPRQRSATVNAELLVIPGCPHAALAETRLLQALAASGHTDVPVHVQVIDPVSGSVPAFAGSPTFLIDGHDLFDAARAATTYAPAGGDR